MLLRAIMTALLVLLPQVAQTQSEFGIDGFGKPTVMLLSERAQSLHAGKLDIYRIRAPRVTGKIGCVQ